MADETKRSRSRAGGEPEGAREISALGAKLGEQIRRLRLDRRWSQRRLADEAGVVQQNLSLYERGLTNPRLETLARLADALDAEVDIVPRSAAQESEQPFSLGTLMEYVDRQIERTLEREREAHKPKRRAG